MKVVCTCGKKLQLPDALVGKGVRCPFCQASLSTAGPAEELPVALDHPPTPDELAARAPKKDEVPFPAPAGNPSDESAAGLEQTLDQLAEAVGQAGGGTAQAPAVRPAVTGPVATDTSPSPAAEIAPASAASTTVDEPSAANGSTPDAGDHLNDLAMALQAGAGQAAPARPAPVRPTAARPTAGRPRPAKAGGRVKAGAPGDEDEADDQPKKKRDLMPIIITASAGFLLVVLAVALIVVKFGGSPKKPNGDTAAQKVTLPEPEDREADYRGGSADFFGDIPAGRTSADYQREQEEKKQNPPN